MKLTRNTLVYCQFKGIGSIIESSKTVVEIDFNGHVERLYYPFDNQYLPVRFADVKTNSLGNCYGHVQTGMFMGECYWFIECHSSMKYQKIPISLYYELRKFI